MRILFFPSWYYIHNPTGRASLRASGAAARQLSATLPVGLFTVLIVAVVLLDTYYLHQEDPTLAIILVHFYNILY